MGDWTEVVTAANLLAGAGSDLQDQRESLAGVTTLTITNAPASWTVRARRGSRRNDNFSLFIRRMSSGRGSGTISGAESYVEITGRDAEVFSGTGDRSAISLQFKLTGLARNVSAATYLSSITFTVQ